MKLWVQFAIAALCGALVYWRIKGSCDWVIDKTYNRLPFVKDKKCSDIKFLKWVLLGIGVCCASSGLSVLRKVFPSYPAYGMYDTMY